MNEANEWASLREAWSSDAPAAAPDVAAMIERARRQRRRTLLVIATEWMIAGVALALLARRWPQLRADALQGTWWGFVMLVTIVVLAISTWTRLRSLREPAGRSLHDWLQLRRRRALLGLRLVTLTRWTVIALLPAVLFSFTAFFDGPAGWVSAAAVALPALVLAAGWEWARRQAPRLRAEIEEASTLAEEWLGEPLDA